MTLLLELFINAWANRSEPLTLQVLERYLRRGLSDSELTELSCRALVAKLQDVDPRFGEELTSSQPVLLVAGLHSVSECANESELVMARDVPISEWTTTVVPVWPLLVGLDVKALTVVFDLVLAEWRVRNELANGEPLIAPEMVNAMRRLSRRQVKAINTSLADAEGKPLIAALMTEIFKAKPGTEP